jgi:hypothetical protein
MILKIENRLKAQANRIETLEAALEKILRHPAGLYEEQAEIACAALDKDTSK